MPKNYRSATYALAVCASLLLIAACTPKNSTAARSAEAATDATRAALRATLSFAEGEVKVDGKAAEIGASLADKARIETGPGSACEVSFGGGNILRVLQNTVVDMDFSQAVKELKLDKGGVAAVLRKLEAIAGQDSFRVTGPVAAAGVRGTSLCVWADPGNTYVCACNGKVRTIDSSGSNELTLTASHHDARLYVAKGSTVSVETAGMLHHTDAALEALAGKLGYTIDWTKPE